MFKITNELLLKIKSKISEKPLTAYASNVSYSCNSHCTGACGGCDNTCDSTCRGDCYYACDDTCKGHGDNGWAQCIIK